MSHIKKYAPRRRFEKFSNADDWEQRKLRDFTKISQGLQIAISDRYLENGDNRELYITNEFLNTYSSPKYYIENPPENVIANEDDILMTRTGNTGKVITNVIGAFHNNFFKIDYNPMKTSKLFLYYVLVSENIQKEILIKAGTSTIPDLKHNDFYSIVIQVPKIQEQQKIGDFFKQLDNTIALHQRKLEKIKALKTAYLSEMFPAEGETKPKRRFGGFTDDWEQRKFSQVADIFDGTHQTPKYTDFGVKFVSVENIATMETKKYISQEAYDKEYSNKKVEQGDVLMTRIGDVGTAKVIETDEPLAYYVTLALLKPKGIDPDFLAQQIASPEVQRSIWKRTLHIAFPKKINLGEINQVSIFIPDLEEQVEIGIFFKQLDKTITIHQRKLQKLQNIKKAYLNEMFI
ncbi:restriction endonuclease subunit S [Listeria monocytogenes]|uniref:restriction endonuclease subunit S n=1 Tax=Listeria monocytogenes TaxID=1639 RepID=UPI0008744968|nr:restriction endonuclease subunit S [Listeria monocytogenes]EAE3727538.1 restriction endonuclease subunit S [Listeria monocytogenes serotype 1/2b]EAC5123584.1 restriction endonuclease subunit S [Listeria monocytogenes]EAC5600150.1 restriction endonuclease subunit S [Listeria monocytogenes]EAC7583449.1 restriction endonuclease subunit S [Listeria monocytogenes]EAC7586842.1 restriction endonuclease subunit S [Listeria monocytogenes]